ncbi:ubiquitin-protein ligase peroxin 12 [Maudiozyma exigua]|uniref:Peroxisome assembly protein 12 n=1 Tax=Maudiozyma exigua TaxID=34358 RepID=A0A9P7BA15_MAUEX|nr:ubiquitin-protein ligase peroxin 12 [Kazachstania exigua]
MSFYSNLPSVQNDSNGLSSYYPTLFELLSSQEIDDLLPASLRYILTKYWITNYPSKFSISVNNYFDEWFSILLKGSIEWYHINKYNSTFVDKYYGLQKINKVQDETVQTYLDLISQGKISAWPKSLQLKKSQKLIIWLEKIILPYLKSKLDDYHKRLINLSHFNNLTNIQKWILKVYPYVRRLLLLLNVIVKLTFVSGIHNSSTILEYLAHISNMRTLLPLNHTDITKSEISNNILLQKKIKFNNFTILHGFNKIISSLWNGFAFTGSQAFPTFMFMLKVYQWWVNQDLTNKLQKAINSIDKEIPKPPLTDYDPDVTSTNRCAICHNEIQNPSMIETGYVMCYPCAVTSLKGHEGVCPVSGQKLIHCKFDKTLNEWDVSRSVRKLLI